MKKNKSIIAENIKRVDSLPKSTLQRALSQPEIKEAFLNNGKKKGSNKTRDMFFAKLEFWCMENGIAFMKEFRFSPYRKFRFDMAFFSNEKKVALEWEGIMSEHSYHTNVKGYTANCDKYNLAQLDGWIVLRYTVLNYKYAFEDLKKALNK
ncbi:MAG TPA: hypothetical protein VK705_04250 [Ferruginibacter sp.]|jgi:hypothetical protein|nr:hypothetical protein [Ferruginibacter sp.]